LADGGPVAVLEALEVHHSVDAREPRGRDAGALAALLDLAAHRDEGVGAPVEPRGDAVQPHRACVVEGTDEAGGGPRAAAPRGVWGRSAGGGGGRGGASRASDRASGGRGRRRRPRSAPPV